MITLEEMLEVLNHRPDRTTLEVYISRAWVRPAGRKRAWRFEAIDIERVRLVYSLHHEMNLGEDAMDIVLHLLDQVYGLREQMRRLHYALERQPETVRGEVTRLLKEAEKELNTPS